MDMCMLRIACGITNAHIHCALSCALSSATYENCSIIKTFIGGSASTELPLPDLHVHIITEAAHQHRIDPALLLCTRRTCHRRLHRDNSESLHTADRAYSIVC